MTEAQVAPVTSPGVEAEESRDDDGPFFPYLPPEDRLWRHPSEMGAGTARAVSNALQRASGGRLWSVALVAGVLGAVVASGVGLATGVFIRHTVVVTVPLPTPDSAKVVEPTAYTSGGWPAIANDLGPSLVAVAAGGRVGSAVVFTASQDVTYLLTSSDLVGGGRVTATFDDGTTKQPAYPVGSEPAAGIALLRVQGTGHEVPTFGSAADLQVASDVLAVGAPAAGVTAAGPGVLSSLDTVLHTVGTYTFRGMMAISGTMASTGFDGAALVDSSGAVVGIETDLTSVDSGMQGMAFAVPIDTAYAVARSILDGTKPSLPWLGIDGAADLPILTAQGLGISGGAVVSAVDPGSPAALAGLQAGDIVTAVNGQRVTSSGGLVAEMAVMHPSEHTTLSYLAGKRAHRVPITVGALPGG